MSKFTEYIGSQFGNPRGFVGKICCIIMNVINNQMYRKTVSMINPEAEKLLDIGYGNGYLLQKLNKKSKKYHLYGIDISEDMKSQAQKRNADIFREGRLHLEVGDCCNLQYENDFFDAISSINTVYFWQDTLKGLQEIRRVLKPDCCFYNVLYTKEWLTSLAYTKLGFKKFNPEELVELGKQAGYSSTDVVIINKGKSFAVVFRK